MHLSWVYKIHCFITHTNHIAIKFNLLLLIPYKETILMTVKRNPYKFNNRSYWQLST